VILRAVSVAGAFIVEPEAVHDERGFFARTFSSSEFAAHALEPAIAQCSISFNPRRGTLRGMHYQQAPHAETKLVRCTRGSVFDVVLDLRRDSPSFGEWAGVELTGENHLAMYVPEGCAHGFQTLTDDAEVFYQISVPFAADAGRGVRWDDSAFGIDWPIAVEVISQRDATYPDFA
jgi:dTDP-4-dehydrorhamnose 3,5-epimerase